MTGSADTIQDLKQRHGVRRWFDLLDVVDLPPASLFPEQTEPFFFVWDRNCLLPPTELECDFDYHRNGPQTHACALGRLTALFGTPHQGVSVNTLEETWKFERMSLRIRTFLPDKTPGRNPTYENHPQLWNFCRISINRNWVRSLTQAEANLLNSLRPSEIRSIERLAHGGTIPRSGASPFLWKQAGHIGWCAGAWSAFFEWSRCVELRLEQVEAGRRSGYSRLVLTLRNPFTLEQGPDNSVLLTGQDTHTLDTAAPEVAAFWELPLKIEESDAD